MEYIYKVRGAPGIGAIRGTAIHEFIAEDNKYYIETGGKRLPKDKLIYIATEKFYKKLEEEGVRLFSRVDGDYFTVLGLPLLELLSYLTLRGEIDG